MIYENTLILFFCLIISHIILGFILYWIDFYQGEIQAYELLKKYNLLNEKGDVKNANNFNK